MQQKGKGLFQLAGFSPSFTEVRQEFKEELAAGTMEGAACQLTSSGPHLPNSCLQTESFTFLIFELGKASNLQHSSSLQSGKLLIKLYVNLHAYMGFKKGFQFIYANISQEKIILENIRKISMQLMQEVLQVLEDILKYTCISKFPSKKFSAMNYMYTSKFPKTINF